MKTAINAKKHWYTMIFVGFDSRTLLHKDSFVYPTRELFYSLVAYYIER